MNQTEQGLAHLANGDVKEAIVAFWAATQEDDTEHQPWLELAVSLALAGRWEDFVRVVNIAKPPVPFFHNVCIYLMEQGEYQLLSEMHRHIPETHIISPVAIYFAGVSLISEKRHADSLEYFHLFKQRVLNNLEHLPPAAAGCEFPPDLPSGHPGRTHRHGRCPRSPESSKSRNGIRCWSSKRRCLGRGCLRALCLLPQRSLFSQVFRIPRGQPQPDLR